MADVLIFDPNSTPVANRALRYLRSVNTPDYAARPDVLVNPVMPKDIALGLLKVAGDQVVELDQADLDAIAAQQASDAAAAEEQRIIDNKRQASKVLDGDETWNIYEQSKLNVELVLINELQVKAAVKVSTYQEVKDAITADIDPLPEVITP